MPPTVETVPGKAVLPVVGDTAHNAPVDPLLLFVIVFLLTAVAGFAALLRSTLTLTIRNILTWTLNSGIAGLCLFWLWQKAYGDDFWGLVGICALVGLGGLPLVEFVTNSIRGVITNAGGVLRSMPALGATDQPPAPPNPPTGPAGPERKEQNVTP